MGRPLVSVLLPVYNGQRYLKEALDSVLSQTLSDFELLVVDDGSTDATPRMLAECIDPRVRVIRLDHVGLIGALNAGFAECSAPFIARMDADDLSYPERLAKQFQFLSQHPETDVVTCWSDLLDDSGRVIGRRTEILGADMLLELAAGNPIVHGSVMVRRSSLPPAPVYTVPPEDYWLWVSLVRSGKRFDCLDDALYGFRTHGERYSLTHAHTQSSGIVAIQWPLLEECSATRDLKRIFVRGRIVRGWGQIAGAAYRSGDWNRANEARRRFLALAGTDWAGELGPAVQHGIESMIWGGCPWYQEVSLRWLEWKQKPTAWNSYRNLILGLPPVRWLTRR
jgi:glycosyltransferase involved in cell wall biosynthesis